MKNINFKIKILSIFLILSSFNFASDSSIKEINKEKDIKLEIVSKKESDKKESLKFDINNYVEKESEINGKIIKYRAYEKIVYVSNPVDAEYQNMNIYIPEEYFNNENIGKYNSENAPIFLPNMVGGYMPARAGEPGEGKDGKPNAIIHALSEGYIVASPGARGRNLSNSENKFIGKAPAGIVDLKAAVKYLHYNDEVMPGSAKRIISNGTSAGGALSVLLGATSNVDDYSSYLKEIGAADGSDEIFAVSAYCPITNLENADAAYEWMYNGVNSYTRMLITRNTTSEQYNNRDLVRTLITGDLTPEEIEISDELKQLFPSYLNSLKLKYNNQDLSLDENGDGSFKEYLKEIVKKSAQKSLDNGQDLSKSDFVKIEDNKVVSIDWDGYRKSGNRMKSPPAFDAIDITSGENNLFGDENIDYKHFTKYSQIKNPGEMADEKIIKMMNPMNYIEKNSDNIPKYWRIRHGSIDKDTSLAIPAIVALELEKNNKNIDFESPWGVGHGGDYDLEELFEWMNKIIEENNK